MAVYTADLNEAVAALEDAFPVFQGRSVTVRLACVKGSAEALAQVERMMRDEIPTTDTLGAVRVRSESAGYFWVVFGWT